MKRLIAVFALLPIASFAQKNVVINEDPADVINKGIELYDAEKYAEAIEEFDKININDTSYANAQYESALSYYKLENYSKAEEILEELLDYKIRFSFKHRVYMLLGNAYDNEKNYDKALEVFTEGLKHYPYQHNLFFNRGLVYENMKQYDKAMLDYQSAIQGNMYHANSHLRLGILAANEGYYQQAMLSLMTFCYLAYDDSRTPGIAALMDQLANGSFEAEKKNFKMFEKDIYEDYNLMFANKNALEDKAKIKLSIPTNYGRQFMFFLRNNHFIEGEMDFWNQHYMRFYDQVSKKKMVDHITMIPLLGIEHPDIQTPVAKNMGKIKAFYTWSGSVFKDESSKQIMEFDGKTQEVYVDYNERYLDGIGHVKMVNKKLTPYGKFNYYYPNGSLKMIAHFTDLGQPMGTWEIFNNFDGTIERRITFTNVEGEKYDYDYYFSGELYEKMHVVNDKLEDSLVRYYRNGTMSEFYLYRNGKRNGLHISYYANGSKAEELTFKEGKREGPYTSYHTNGQKETEFTFVNDKPNGVYKTYYPDGTLKEDYIYKDGKYDGPYTEYHANGKIMKKGTYKNGIEVGEYNEYWSNGSLLSQMNLDESGKQNGNSVFFDFDGKKYESLEFSKGDLKSIKYYDKAGNEKVVATKKGKTLDYERTFSNGKTNTKGSYVDNQRQGEWLYYDFYGNLTRREKYVDGKLVDTVFSYHSNGQINKMLLVKDGEYNGLYLEYNKFGDLIAEGTFKNGSYDNAWYSYYTDGSMSDRDFYVQDTKQGFQITYDVNGKMNTMEEYDNGRIIAHTFFDTTETIISQIGEYNGEIKLMDPTNKYVVLKANYKNGYADGDFTWYIFGDKISCKGQFKNGKRVGKWSYYTYNGKLKREIEYVDGQVHGKDIEYYENGNKRYEIGYQHNQAEGPFQFFHENGKVESEGTFLDDERHGRVTYYSLNGQVAMIRTYHLGRITSYTYLDAAGKEVKPVELENKEIKFVTYYKNGKKSNEHMRKNGLIEGKYIAYHDNGKISDESNYLHGEENGPQMEYNELGQKTSEINFVKGQRHGKALTYHSNGKIKEESNYKFGKLNGDMKIYNSEGKLITIITYYDDEVISVKNL